MSLPAERRKLIFAWPYVEWGGAQIYFLAIMKIAKSDWDILVLLPRDSSSEMLRHLKSTGVKYEFTDTHSDLGPARSILRKIARHRRRIHDLRMLYRRLCEFDLPRSIVHIEVAPWQDWIFLTLLSLRRANVFVTMHNFPEYASQVRAAVWWVRLQFVSRLRGFHILASNKDTKNRLEGWVESDFQKRVPVTYTCVDPVQIEEALAEPFDVLANRQKLGIPEDHQVVLCVGQFIDRKGRWTFLDAARRVLEKRRSFSFVWVSPRLPTEEERRRIEDYELGSGFRMVISNDIGERLDVLRFFRIADVYAQPSQVEGLPIALLEAMAMGLPVISTDVYAIPEAVRDRDTGLLVDPTSPRQLAEAILELADDPQLRNSLSRAGRQIVIENFDERVASQIAIAAYTECFADG